MDMTPPKEHKDQRRIEEDIFYLDHTRTDSATFEATKKAGHAQHIPCMISGHAEGVEYHHFFCEWAFSDAVDWETVKGVALGTITRLPLLDLETDQPLVSGETYDAKQSLLWVICKLIELRGFDWSTFDPTKPETLVDSMANMMVLHEKFHRGKDHGIHMMTFPVWSFQAFPRKKGFVFSPDELQKMQVTS